MRIIRRERRVYQTVIAGVLTLHAALLAWGALRHSPTVDEVGHLVAGLSHWQFGRFDLYRVNPPLVRLVAALSVLVSRPETDWTSWSDHPKARSEFSLGRKFIDINGERSFWYFTLARWACIPFSLLGAYICWRWAGELYGQRAGLLALILWCFSPNVLAHAQLTTPDAGATALGVTAMYVFWRWLCDESWSGALAAGLVTGLVQLTKTTWILLFAIGPVIWLVWRLSGQRRQQAGRQAETSSGSTGTAPQSAHADGVAVKRVAWKTSLGQLILIMLVAVYVINVGYGFEGSFKRLGDFPFVSRSFVGRQDGSVGSAIGRNRFSGSLLGRLPVPLPENYVRGIDVQKSGFEANQPSYLRGQVRSGGWWYYYLYALAVKVPLGTWLLLCVGLGLSLARSDHRVCWRDELVLLILLLAILVFVSSQMGINKHLRYVLPIFPFAFIWTSKVAVAIDWRRQRVLSAAIVGGALWMAAGSLWIYPHSLSYFNELAGGPKKGGYHLLSSNIAWGQDLLYLKRWLDAHPEARPLSMAVHCSFDPRVAGIEFALPPKGPVPDGTLNSDAAAGDFHPPPGWYAVDVNLLYGYPNFIPDGRGGQSSVHQPYYTYFQRFRPVARAGYSIYIYHVPGQQSSDIQVPYGPSERICHISV